MGFESSETLGIPMDVVAAFLIVYAGLFVLFQVEVGVSMIAGFVAGGIVFVVRHTRLLDSLKQDEEDE